MNDNYDLKYCQNCNQMTNHSEGACQKCSTILKGTRSVEEIAEEVISAAKKFERLLLDSAEGKTTSEEMIKEMAFWHEIEATKRERAARREVLENLLNTESIGGDWQRLAEQLLATLTETNQSN